MTPAAYYRLCSKGSVWTGVFMRSSRSTAQSESVIIFTEYRLFLPKTIYFIRFINARSMQSSQIINRYGVNVSPCKTQAKMSKNSVSTSFAFVFFVEHHYSDNSFFNMQDEFDPPFLCIWNKIL